MSSEQLALVFEVDQERLPDGRIALRPRRVVTGRRRSARWVARRLGIDRKEVGLLVMRGELAGYKLPGRARNARWRISEESVIEWESRVQSAAKGGF